MQPSFDKEAIRVLMINEVVPQNPDDDFYSKAEDADYMRTTRGLFAAAGIEISTVADLLQKGFLLTNAVKQPKDGYDVPLEAIKRDLPVLTAEIDALPNLAAIMLMGDAAKKAFNLYARTKTGKNCIPSGSTYKIRKQVHQFGSIRVFPSYIMTGGNILIEKSKRDMIAEDIRTVLTLL